MLINIIGVLVLIVMYLIKYNLFVVLGIVFIYFLLGFWVEKKENMWKIGEWFKVVFFFKEEILMCSYY